MVRSENTIFSENQLLSIRSTKTIRLVTLVSSLDKAALRKFISMMSSIFLLISLNKRLHKRSLPFNFWRKFWFKPQKLKLKKNIELILLMLQHLAFTQHSVWDCAELSRIVAHFLRFWLTLIIMLAWNSPLILQLKPNILIILSNSLASPLWSMLHHLIKANILNYFKNKVLFRHNVPRSNIKMYILGLHQSLFLIKRANSLLLNI